MGSKISRLTSWPLFTREIKLNISLPTSRESSVIKDLIWIILSYHAGKFQIVRWLFRFYIHYRIAAGVRWCLVGLGRGQPGCAAPSCSPMTIEPSKPRLCCDERYLNLWIKDFFFKLDHLLDLPRYVLPGHYQTSLDEKSGCQHVSLHSSSHTFFGLQWQGFYFVFCMLPFSWKASAFLYHNLVLAVSGVAFVWCSYVKVHQ